MLSFRFFLLLTTLLRAVSCADGDDDFGFGDDDLPDIIGDVDSGTMQMFEDSEGQTKGVWFAQYPGGGQGQAAPAPARLMGMAQRHFQWLKDNVGSAAETSSAGNSLVSLMYDPNSKWYFASTIPRGDRLGVMRASGATAAPVWWQYASTTYAGQDLTNPDAHAEDGVYFVFETSGLYQKPANGAANYRLNGNGIGPILSTYGSFQGQESGRWTCFRPGATKDPACQDTANNLGVRIVPGNCPANLNPTTRKLRRRQDDDYCVLPYDGDEPTTPDEFVCTEDTVDQCAPDVVCHAPEYAACEDGKCICAEDEPEPTPEPTPEPFVCTEDTVDQCAPDLVCHAPEYAACEDGGCICASDPPDPTITPPPEAPSCEMQDAIPDRYDTGFCRCVPAGEDGTVTLPLITVDNPDVVTESCAYSSMPSSTPTKVVTTESLTYTVSCHECLATEGAATEDFDLSNTETCTPIPACPTYAVRLGNEPVPAGTSVDTEEDAIDLGNAMIKALKEQCPEPDDGETGSCVTEVFDIMDTTSVVSEAINNMVLQGKVIRGAYADTQARDSMIYTAVSTWLHSAQNTCGDATYIHTVHYDDGCDESLEGRTFLGSRSFNDSFTALGKRLPPDGPDETASNDLDCYYVETECTGAKYLYGFFGTTEEPYRDDFAMEINLVLDNDGIDDPFAEWLCEAVIEGLALAAVRFLPKLAGFEVVGDVQDYVMEATCGDGDDGDW